MRPIDADVLFEAFNKAAWFDNADRDDIALELVLGAPTIAPPPNDPLTLEELREMDGEPVFVTKNGESIGYALVYSLCSIVYITCSTGSKWDAEDLIDKGGKFYRRRPEEGVT